MGTVTLVELRLQGIVAGGTDFVGNCTGSIDDGRALLVGQR